MVKAGKWLRSLLGAKRESTVGQQGKGTSSSKGRWSFGRSKSAQTTGEANGNGSVSNETKFEGTECFGGNENEHAMAVAAATTAAAEAAVAAAQAAAAVARLTSCRTTLHRRCSSQAEWAAAVKIQAVFRGHLARRALRALRGLVKLQALVRGHIVRKQAATTLRCMQALVRVQARVRASRVRNSEEGQAVQHQLQQRRLDHQRVPAKNSMNRWSSEAKPAGGGRKGTTSNQRTTVTSSAARWTSKPPLSNGSVEQQVSDSGEPDEQHWGWTWLERWMAGRPWESPLLLDNLMMAADSEDCPAKIVEMDTGHPNRRKGSISEAGSVSTASTPLAVGPVSPFAPVVKHKSGYPESGGGHFSIPSPASSAESVAGEHGYGLHIPDEENVMSMARSSPRLCGRRSLYSRPRADRTLESYGDVPNYMMTTQSAKNKVRSQSAPRERPADPLVHKPSLLTKAQCLPMQEGRAGVPLLSSAGGAARMQRSSSSQQARSAGVSGSSGLYQTMRRVEGEAGWRRESDSASLKAGDLGRWVK